MKNSCPEVHRAEFLQIFQVKFWKIDDLKNSFRDLLTFKGLDIKGVDFKDEDVSAACTNIEEIDIRG